MMIKVLVGLIAFSIAGGVAYVWASKRTKDIKQKSAVPACPQNPSEPERGKLSDRQIIERLSPAFRGLFPSNLGDDFSLRPGWLFEKILVGKFDGDNHECDQLLKELIAVSDGVFRAAAKVGDVFNCNFMHTNSELPDDMKISVVKRRGLVRVLTKEVLIDAEVV